MSAADDQIAVRFVQANGYNTRTLAWVQRIDDKDVVVPISEDEAEILRGLDSYYASESQT